MTDKHIYSRPNNPFDDSAAERLRHMGLLDAADEPNRDMVEAAAQIYAGLFYDELCDFFGDLDSVKTACRGLIERTALEEAKSKFLAICSAYDAAYSAIPEPIWWLSGNTALVSAFTDSFLKRLTAVSDEAG